MFIHIFANCQICNSSPRPRYQQHLFLFHQLPRQLQRLLGVRAAIVERNEDYLSSVYAAVIVHHIEIGFFGASSGSVLCKCPGIRHKIAYLDLTIGCARIIFLRVGRDSPHGYSQQQSD